MAAVAEFDSVGLRYGTGVLVRTPLLSVLLFVTRYHHHILLFTGPVNPPLLEQAATDLIGFYARGP